MENNIFFEPLKESYIEIVREWRNSDEVSKYMYTENKITPEEQVIWFNSVNKDPTKRFWIIKLEKTPIGLVSLYNINYLFKSCYWAFYIGDNTIRGGGIGSKVEFNLLCEVFDKMGFNKLLCEVFVSNEKVIKMHEKFGFRREGYFREHILKNNNYHDVVSLAILKSEWEKIKEYHKNRILKKTN